jgi:chromosome segregation ATPase
MSNDPTAPATHDEIRESQRAERLARYLDAVSRFAATSQELRQDLQSAATKESQEIDGLKSWLAETARNQRDTVSRLDQIISGQEKMNDLGRMIRREDDRLGSEIAKLRTDIMARLDRQQDEQTKQRTEMEAAIELLKDSSPPALLLRIRQLEDEIRELKEDQQEPPAS